MRCANRGDGARQLNHRHTHIGGVNARGQAIDLERDERALLSSRIGEIDATMGVKASSYASCANGTCQLGQPARRNDQLLRANTGLAASTASAMYTRKRRALMPTSVCTAVTENDRH